MNKSNNLGFNIIAYIFLLINLACNTKENNSLLKSYEGPISEMNEVQLTRSDSAKVKTILIANKLLEYSDGNMDFPKGIEIRFLKENGDIESKITAEKGFYNRKENLYFGQGNVIVENYEKKQKLTSEELYWNSNSKRIYSNSFVTIKENQKILNGTSFESNETFTNYTLHNSSGKIPIPGD